MNYECQMKDFLLDAAEKLMEEAGVKHFSMRLPAEGKHFPEIVMQPGTNACNGLTCVPESDMQPGTNASSGSTCVSSLGLLSSGTSMLPGTNA